MDEGHACHLASVYSKHRGCSTPQPHDFYEILSDNAAQQLAFEVLDPSCDERLAFAEKLHGLKRHDRFRETVVNDLRRYLPAVLLRHHHRLIDRGFLLAVDALRAEPDVIERLREIAADPQSPHRRAAVWVLLNRPGAGEDVYEAYLRDVQPQDDWQRWDLDILKHTAAGWEPDGRGGRRLLRVEPRRVLCENPAGGEPLVRPDDRLESACPSCGRNRMVVMFDLDTTREDLQWLRLPQARLRLPACEFCMWMSEHEGYVFCEVDTAGGVRPRPDLSPRNTSDEDSPWEILPKQPLYLRQEQAAGDCPGTGTLGGLPTFEQDPEWPHCPSCSLLMRYVGQLATGGWTYSFLCPDCMLATWGTQID